jgi:hypothetical protein
MGIHTRLRRGQAKVAAPPPPDLARRQSYSFTVIATTFILLLVISLAASWAAIRIVDATRAYATGEGRYSKAQKIAVIELHRFACSGRSSDYAAFLAAIAVPRGDRDARLALAREPVDSAAAARGFSRAGTIAPMWQGSYGFSARSPGGALLPPPSPTGRKAIDSSAS